MVRTPGVGNRSGTAGPVLRAAARALAAQLENPLGREQTLAELLRRPELDYGTLMGLEGMGPGAADPQVAEQVQVQAKYAGYIERQALVRRAEHLPLEQHIASGRLFLADKNAEQC